MIEAKSLGAVTHTHTQYNLIENKKAGKTTALLMMHIRDGLIL